MRTSPPSAADPGSSRSSTGCTTPSTTGTTRTKATGRRSSSSSTQRTPPRRSNAGRRSSATASTRVPSKQPGATTSSRSSAGPIPSCTRRLDPMRISSTKVSTSAARRPRAWAATARRAHVRHPPGSADDPERCAQARDRFPWIEFEGRWGELQRSIFNGPTGPNLKSQWTEPIEWSEGWRHRSLAVPGGGASGRVRPTSSATPSLAGSNALRRAVGGAADVVAHLYRPRPSSSASCSRVRRGRPRRRCGSPADVRGDRCSRPRAHVLRATAALPRASASSRFPSPLP